MGETWEHDALAEDLADHLTNNGNRLAWTDLVLGVGGSARPDVFAMDRHSHAHPNLVTYEVKVTTEDLRRDVTEGKWQSYLAYSQGVVFAVPHGLAKLSNIPEGCGLMVRGPHGWTTRRKPTLRALEQLPADVAVKLVRQAHASWQRHPVARTALAGRDDAIPQGILNREQALARKRIQEDLGPAIARFLQEREKAYQEIDWARSQAKHIQERAQERAAKEGGKAIQTLREVAINLGLDPDDALTFPQLLADRIRNQAERAQTDDVLQKALRGLENAERAVARAREQTEWARAQQLQEQEGEPAGSPPLHPDKTTENSG